MNEGARKRGVVCRAMHGATVLSQERRRYRRPGCQAGRRRRRCGGREEAGRRRACRRRRWRRSRHPRRSFRMPTSSSPCSRPGLRPGRRRPAGWRGRLCGRDGDGDRARRGGVEQRRRPARGGRAGRRRSGGGIRRQDAGDDRCRTVRGLGREGFGRARCPGSGWRCHHPEPSERPGHGDHGGDRGEGADDHGERGVDRVGDSRDELVEPDGVHDVSDDGGPPERFRRRG